MSARAILAFLITLGAFVVFGATDKLSFEQFLLVVTPVVSLYFGQYATAPGSNSGDRRGNVDTDRIGN